MPSHRILLIGATGVFGERLARMIVRWPDATLVLAARRLEPLQALAARLDGPASVETAVFDRTAPEGLAALKPWAVVDAAGPFQSSDYRLPLAALAAGAHYVDLADGRDFVAGFAAAVRPPTGLTAMAGASSTPTLSQAALARMTAGWTAIDAVSAAISPGGQAPRGRSAMAAILAWAGRPVRLFEAGRWTTRPGWSGPVRLRFPFMGNRWVVLADVPDLDAMPARQAPKDSAIFRAGVESPVGVWGLWLGVWLVRLGVVRSLTSLTPLLWRLTGLLTLGASDLGGMVVQAAGRDAEGRAVLARWSLWAEPGEGPSTPAAPAAAVLRGLLDGVPGPPTLDAILAQLRFNCIHTRLDVSWPEARGLVPGALGPGYERLPPTVRAMHAGLTPIRAEGTTLARGSAGLAALVRAVLGLPANGRHPAVVEIVPHPYGEAWVRRFGSGRFASRITPCPDDPGAFEETAGPISFRIRLDPDAAGFTWRLDGWRLGPLPLPRRWAPRVRARSFERDGVYRFRVMIAHPWLGVVFAYAGRLTSP
ncbi:hypothetical protein QO010_003261 [Caulobacter ginsengisoli]|uniref:Saccharopine dehydrogenase n=1 Tax=Caulobacter ginsengisoli TaxID=400775 RepID=A0ABU0ITZ3_9CAUL|nr:DUF4166 domain-containing protein [Caulobacter ginsengisoli]MDQ0465472.1 hypothetical protein [Caulobacter ginsengisoli]